MGMKFEELYNIVESSDPAGNCFWHVTPCKNVASIMEKGLIPQIGKQSQKLGEDSNGVYLFDDVDMMEDAVMNWLGDELDEDGELCLLKITVPAQFMKSSIVFDGFSCVATSIIPPEYIEIDQSIDLN